MPLILFVRQRRLDNKLTKLEAQFRSLEEPTDRRSGSVPLPEQAEDKEPATEDGGNIPDDLDLAPEPVTETESPARTPETGETPEPSQPTKAAASPWGIRTRTEPGKSSRKAKAVGSVEERFAARWMIWLGGLTVALSAVFLFRYAVDQGWLTPMTRVILGLLLGAALLPGGEWTLRNPVPRLGRALNTDYVPPALTASGLFAIYVSLFAAHALFGLLTPMTGFVALGLVAYAALGLALRQGWFVAFLGLIAGYLVPALIDTPNPQATPLFLYLLILTSGCLALMIWRKWWWFSALTLIGALFWPVSWVFENWNLADQGVLGAYALALAALFGALSVRLPVKQREDSMVRWLWALLQDTAGLGYALTGGLVLLLADAAYFNGAAFMFIVAYAAIAMALAFWRPKLEGLLAIAALISLASMLVWPQPPEVSLPEEVQRLGTGSAGNAFGPFVMPPEFAEYARALWSLAALFGIGGLFGLGRARTLSLWSGLSAAMPVLLLVLGYWRIGAFEIDVQWAGLAAGLAVLFLVAASMVHRLTGTERRDLPLAFYAAGCTAALALAFTCLMREAWLTVAISIEVLALAWIWSRIAVDELRAIAGVVVLIVIVRLVLNPELLDYRGTVLGQFGWVIYGYGIPALAIGTASVLFGRDKKDLLVVLCEITAAGFAFLMVALQLKLWTSGTIHTYGTTLFDQAVQSIWWITAAAILLQRGIVSRYRWASVAGVFVLSAAGLQVGLGQVLVNNPLLNSVPVGQIPLVNLLGLAYLLPALMFALIANLKQLNLPDRGPQLLHWGAGLLTFVYITLETRRTFWGSDMELTSQSVPKNAEIYAYSAVWILFALAILAAGIRRKSVALRYASLAVLIVTVAKVFLYDMSDLTGLFRVASFLGLGLTLIGIGRVYQKYVFTK